MLVLTRDEGEKIYIGDDVIITLVSVESWNGSLRRARIGIEAPHSVPVHREEVYIKIREKESKNE